MMLASKEEQKLGYDVAARVTIAGAADMTDDGRKQIAAWLRKQANDLVKDGDNYSSRFVARYYYKV